MTINVQGLIDVLPIMGQGLLGVFAVIAVVWLAIAALARVIK